jgi:hypothetical protein
MYQTRVKGANIEKHVKTREEFYCTIPSMVRPVDTLQTKKKKVKRTCQYRTINLHSKFPLFFALHFLCVAVVV